MLKLVTVGDGDTVELFGGIDDGNCVVSLCCVVALTGGCVVTAYDVIASCCVTDICIVVWLLAVVVSIAAFTNMQ